MNKSRDGLAFDWSRPEKDETKDAGENEKTADDSASESEDQESPSEAKA